MVRKASQYGQMLVFFALSLPFIIIIVLFISSIGMVFVTKNELQNAVDAAALAAVRSFFEGTSPEKTADNYLKQNFSYPFQLEISIEDVKTGALVTEQVAKDLALARHALEKEQQGERVFYLFPSNEENNDYTAREQTSTLNTNIITDTKDLSTSALEDFFVVSDLLEKRKIEKQNLKEPTKSLQKPSSDEKKHNLQMGKITIKASVELELLLVRFISLKNLPTIHIKVSSTGVLAPEVLKGEAQKEKVPALGVFVPDVAPFALVLEDEKKLDFHDGVTSPVVLELSKMENGMGLLPIVYQESVAQKLLERVKIAEKIDPRGEVKALPTLPYDEFFSFATKLKEGKEKFFYAGYQGVVSEKSAFIEEKDLFLDNIVPKEKLSYLSENIREETSSMYKNILEDKDEAPYARDNLPSISEYIFKNLKKRISENVFDLDKIHRTDKRLILLPVIKLDEEDFLSLKTGDSLFTEDKIFCYDLEGKPLATYVGFYVTDFTYNEESSLLVKGFFLRVAVPNGTNAYFAATRKNPAKLTGEFVEQKIVGSEFYLKPRVRLF